MPAFPERYLTGCLVGRIDLIDVISLEEYQDTIPQVLKEPTEASFQFICRNPCILDIPLQMSGQPAIYKLPKDVFLGAKDKLRKVQYTWWPPEEYKNFTIGRFDLYPDDYVQWTRDEIITYVEKNQVNRNPNYVQISKGCYHLKNFLNASGQQGFIDGIRELCFENPQKMRFQACEKLVKEYLEDMKSLDADETSEKK